MIARESILRAVKLLKDRREDIALHDLREEVMNLLRLFVARVEVHPREQRWSRTTQLTCHCNPAHINK